jgi:hypothetical protein
VQDLGGCSERSGLGRGHGDNQSMGRTRQFPGTGPGIPLA